MKEMTPTDIAWLTGIMEGEASIGTWNASGRKANIPSKHTKYAKVTVSSSDKEILEICQSITGLGSIVLHYGNSVKKKESHKQTWTWTIGKAEDVLQLLNAVISYGRLSEHRRKQISEAIEAASEIAERKRSGESYKRKK